MKGAPNQKPDEDPKEGLCKGAIESGERSVCATIDAKKVIISCVIVLLVVAVYHALF
jgi:hypothetical protein